MGARASCASAGLDALPGGGAEVFSERVRREIFHQKIGAQRWLEIHEIAHGIGIPSNATLLYGHIETRAERVQHMILLRELEDRAPGFFAFIPLAFQPGTTGLVRRQASAIEDLKTIAISRLVFDNVPHVKSYWIMLGQDTAGVAINFGASDLDGTIGVEKIAHAALARSPVGMAEDVHGADHPRGRKESGAARCALPRDQGVRLLVTPAPKLTTATVAARIPYANAAPFYALWGEAPFAVRNLVPRELGREAEAGAVDLGLMATGDYLRLARLLRAGGSRWAWPPVARCSRCCSTRGGRPRRSPERSSR